MEKEIKILISKFGSEKRVADELGITLRHLQQNVMKGKHLSKSLKKLIAKEMIDAIPQSETN